MWKNLLLAPVAILIGLLMFEGLARVWTDVPSAYPIVPGLLVLEERGFWMPSPGYEGEMDNRVDFAAKPFRIDSKGTRNVPCAPNAGDARSRVFLLGDSQTFGFGLSDAESWPNQLQCALGGSVRVVNMGVHGTNIDQYVKRGLTQVREELEPGDVVVVGVTWNDLLTPVHEKTVDQLRDNARQPKSAAGSGVTLAQPVRHAGPATWRYEVYQRTGILVPVFSSLTGFAESLTYTSALAGILVPRLRMIYYRFRPSDTFASKLDPARVERNVKLLSILDAELKKTGARMIVYQLPNRLFFDDSYYGAYSAGGAAFPQQDYMSYLVAPLCRQFGLDCMTAFDALKTPGPDDNTFRFDGHYNPKGAALVADRLEEYLTRECVAEGRPCLLLER